MSLSAFALLLSAAQPAQGAAATASTATAAAVAVAPAPAGTATRAPDNVFIKGELAHAGTVRLVPKRSFVGLRLGILVQETTLFATVAPKVDLFFLEKRLRVGLDVPLNLEIYSARAAADGGEGKDGFENLFRLRKADWDDARDYVKVLRYFTYGRKEDNFFLNVGQLYATTIGHGQAMRRYAGNVDVNSTKVGAELDAYGDYGGFELSVADVTRGNLFAMLAFVKPLSLFSDDLHAKSVSLGFGWASDQKAPWVLERGAQDLDPLGIGVIQVDEFGAPRATTRAVNVLNVDAEVKVLKNETSDLKVYADYSALTGSGGGLTLGVLGRFNFRGEDALQLLRARLELRSYDPGFQPSYFDVLYEYQKYLWVRDAARPDSPTKLQAILQREGSRRFGAYAEVSYALDGWFIAALAVEAASGGDDDRNLMLHVEIPWHYLDVFATYHQRGFQRLFTLDQNDVLYAGARIQLLPILFLNGRVQKNFAWDPSLHEGRGGYGENLSYQVDGELGFEL